jgi:NAD(P)-dependent dehydrogenase (short-subunit alcohol dehydrogenase family)
MLRQPFSPLGIRRLRPRSIRSPSASPPATARKVRVNAIYPEIIATDMTGAWASLEETMTSTGRDRIGQSDDFVGTCVLLASEASTYVTGAVMPVS